MEYNWQLDDWPNFQYKTENLENDQNGLILKAGLLFGLTETVKKSNKTQTIIELMVKEAIKSSEIEGEFLSREDVMSSIKKNLGIHEEANKSIKNHRAKGIAYLVVETQKTFDKPLTEIILFDWHKQLMQAHKNIHKGIWRSHSSPMQVVSGSVGKETIHFEAPESVKIKKEMDAFFDWFNDSAPKQPKSIANPIIRAAISHLYFESIHPFEDGNGRIGRAIAEKALFQGIGRPILISLSSAIEADKKSYYQALKQAQKTLDITKWLKYFSKTVFEAQEIAHKTISFSLKKVHLFDHYKDQLTERESKVINKILDAGADGFEGGMTAKKYMSITKVSKASATRDLQHLLEIGVFSSNGGGRSVQYEINFDAF